MKAVTTGVEGAEPESPAALLEEAAPTDTAEAPKIRQPLTHLGLGLLAVCLFVEQARVLLDFSRQQTNEDQTLLWYAGRQLLGLHLHEPNFYGQRYNTVFEAIPGELIHLLGVSLGTAIPLGTTLIATACWVVLAAAAYYRKQYVGAAVALALPLCFGTAYMLLFDAPRGVLSGDLFAALAVAGAVAIRRPQWRLAFVMGIGGLAFLWDYAAVLAVAPVAAVSVMQVANVAVRQWRSTILAVAAGGVLPLSWWILDREWYASHPVDVTAPPVASTPQLLVLRHNLHHLNRLVDIYNPQLWPSPDATVALVVALVIAAAAVGILRRRVEALIAGLGLFAVIVVTLSVRKTVDSHPGLYLSGGRFLLPLPIGIWAVAYFMMSRQSDVPGVRRGPLLTGRGILAAVAVVGVIGLGSTIRAEADLGSTIHSYRVADQMTAAVVPPIDPPLLLAQCGEITSLYRHDGAQLLVTDDRSVAYGCAAATGINTLDRTYDRRGWLLREAAVRPLSRILLQGFTCAGLTVEPGTCDDVGPQLVLLTTTAEPAALTLGLANLPVRGAPLNPVVARVTHRHAATRKPL